MTDFLTHARAYGVLVEDIHPSSRIRRCGTDEHPHSKNGAYLWDGERGWVQSWDQGGELYWWDDEDKQEPTQAMREEWARKKAQREVEQQRMWGASAVKCQKMLDSCKPAEHNYFHRKGLKDVKWLVLPDGGLFIPMRNFKSGNICGGQVIRWDGELRKFEKKYMFGSQPRGAALLLGPAQATEIVLCEGYATGLSIDKALQQMRLRASVLVCFNDGNLINIAKATAGVPRRYVFADNDQSEAGESAAQATGLSYCMSPILGEDANDMHQRAGLMPVCNLIMEARRLKKPETI